MVIRPTSPLRPELRSAAAASRRGRRPNQRLERTGARPVRHGRASVGAGRSTAGRWADSRPKQPARESMIEMERVLATNRAGWNHVASMFHGGTALPEYGPLVPTED